MVVEVEALTLGTGKRVAPAVERVVISRPLGAGALRIKVTLEATLRAISIDQVVVVGPVAQESLDLYLVMVVWEFRHPSPELLPTSPAEEEVLMGQ